jgi:hypothetical protein
VVKPEAATKSGSLVPRSSTGANGSHYSHYCSGHSSSGQTGCERDKPGRYTPPRSHPGTPRVPPHRTHGPRDTTRHAAAPVVCSTRTRRRPLLGLLLTSPGRAWERSHAPMPTASTYAAYRGRGKRAMPRSRSWTKQQQATEKEEAVAVPVPTPLGSVRLRRWLWACACAAMCGLRRGPRAVLRLRRPSPVCPSRYPDSGRRGCGSRGHLTCMRSHLVPPDAFPYQLIAHYYSSTCRNLCPEIPFGDRTAPRRAPLFAQIYIRSCSFTPYILTW